MGPRRSSTRIRSSSCSSPMIRSRACTISTSSRNCAATAAVAKCSSMSAQPDGAEIAIQGMAQAPTRISCSPIIVPAQLLGLRVSQALGLTPDRPNASGTVNRVVQGVRIHGVPHDRDPLPRRRWRRHQDRIRLHRCRRQILARVVTGTTYHLEVGAGRGRAARWRRRGRGVRALEITPAALDFAFSDCPLMARTA
jgi:hypothetical protein